jgi:hypothetical protein
MINTSQLARLRRECGVHLQPSPLSFCHDPSSCVPLALSHLSTFDQFMDIVTDGSYIENLDFVVSDV